MFDRMVVLHPPFGRPSIIVRVRKFISPVLALTLSGCSGVLDPRGPVGASEKLILIDSMTIMLTIVVPVILATLGFAWWFRASNTRATYRPNWDFSGSLELIIWAIPALVITFLGGIAWFGSQALDPFRPLDSPVRPVEVEAVSLDWKWLFIYPDEGIATVNQLVVPAGTPLHFKITSASVWNAFFVPQLGSMIYSMAGMTTQLNLQADKPGTYPGLSSQFSGDKFSDMHFDVRAVEGDAFHQWVAGVKESGEALDVAAYARLAQTVDSAPPTTYKAVDPTLFAAIVAGTAPESGGAPPITNAP
jgi:cytochrome o ubiquinol oxidase subunit 2